MLSLPPQFIVFDTEYTAWEGSRERNWSGPGEYREMVQIAAARVIFPSLASTETFVRFIKPVKNPRLSDYFINLTGITQQQVDEHDVPFTQAIGKFATWAQPYPLYCFGVDYEYLVDNCRLLGVPFPFAPSQFSNLKELFIAHGIAAEQYMSSTIVEAFGVTPTRRGHDALNDVKTIVDGLRLLQLSLT